MVLFDRISSLLTSLVAVFIERPLQADPAEVIGAQDRNETAIMAISPGYSAGSVCCCMHHREGTLHGVIGQ